MYLIEGRLRRYHTLVSRENYVNLGYVDSRRLAAPRADPTPTEIDTEQTLISTENGLTCEMLFHNRSLPTPEEHAESRSDPPRSSIPASSSVFQRASARSTFSTGMKVGTVGAGTVPAFKHR